METCSSCGGVHLGPCTKWNGPAYTIPGGEICKICGLRFYNRSMGGPGICPACDCGFTGEAVVKAQRDEIERLRQFIRYGAAECPSADMIVDFRAALDGEWLYQQIPGWDRSKPLECPTPSAERNS